MTMRPDTYHRQRLLEKLDELSRNKGRRDELIAERSNDPMDEMQSRVDLDLTVRFVNTDFQTKRAIEKALRLLDEGEYGICQDCGDLINPRRLEAIPWTTLCVGCQEERDGDPARVDEEFAEAA